VGIPFVFLATVLQGASLGRGNAWRPLRIFGAAGIVNLIGDVYLTLFKGMGATGAAIATVVAQIGAAVYYAVTTSRLDKSVEASSQPKRDVALTWKGFASKSMLQTFASVAITLFSRSIGMMMSFSLLTRAAALSGTAALAAHQVTLQVWWLISFLPEPMSVAAQTLITRDMNERPSRVPKLIKTLYQMSAVLGVSASILTLVALSAPSIVGALVADVSVQKLIASLVPFAVLSQGYCPLATLSDGVCIGLGSFGHLPGIMISSFAATSAALSLVAKYNLGVVGVWGCMNVFLGTRVLGHIFTSTKLRESVRKAFGRRESRFQVDAVAI
jgi:Na+-driven multidrug efflux pump